MLKLLFLIFAIIILFGIFIATIILVIVKKSKRLLSVSAISFLSMIGVGIYTAYFGVKKGTEKAKSITRETFQKVYPTFDSNQPDTEANKKNFKAFLQVDITPDVKNIYCFDDAIGIDADYMFSFNCDSITSKKIKAQHFLEKDSVIGLNEEGLQHDFFWWDKQRIKELQSYSWHSGSGRSHKMFWYDKENQKAYYFKYSL